jgi:LytR cell envelope-related transcriptional attenuator
VHLPFALSPSHFISNVGSDAGFAALIGLAILVLLYFAHAREATSLREQLAAAWQRIEALERRLSSATVSAPAPVAKPPVTTAVPAPAKSPLPSSVPVPATAAATSPTGAPTAAPAGVGAPALIDATRVVPAFEEVAQSAESDATDGADAPPADGHKAPAAVPAQALLAPGGTGIAPGETDIAATPPPAKPPPPAPLRPAVGKTPSPVTAAAGGNGSAPPQEAQGLRPGSLLREGLPGQRRRRSLRLATPILVGLVAIAAAVAIVLIVTSGSTTHKAAHRAAPSQMALALRKVVPSSVTVAVLNGTSVNELAHRTGRRLMVQGFKEGQLATASNQSVKRTTVAYLPGHRLAALAVAHALKLTAAAVAPAQSASKALACPGTAPCAADVIVTVGSDLAHAP